VDFEKNVAELEKNMHVIERCKVFKKSYILESVNDIPIKDFFRKKYKAHEKNIEEFCYTIKRDKIKGQTEIGLALFSKATNGILFHGISLDSPFRSHPSIVNLDDFHDASLVMLDPTKRKFEEYVKILGDIKEDRINMVFLDTALLEFTPNKLHEKISTLNEFKGFGIVTSPPCAYLPENIKPKNLLSELKPCMFISLGGMELLINL
jgi:hypothetical protein